MRRVHPISRPLLLGLLAASFLLGAFRSPACQYCRLAATDPEAAKMAAQMHAGGFPLDATLSQFQPVAPAATLTAPPAPDRVATSAADLPSVPRALAALKPEPAATLPSVAVPSAKAAGMVIRSKAAPAQAAHWADAGLLGLLSVGGWFCWRTRRVSAPVG